MLKSKTLLEAINLFLQNIVQTPKYSKHTQEAYQRDLNKFSIFIGNDTKVVDILSEDLSGFLIFLMEKSMAASSQSRLVSTLKRFGSFLLHHNYIKKNYFQFLIFPKVPKKLSTVVSTKILQKALSKASQSFLECRVKLCLEILYGSGLRIGELVNLTWKNFDKTSLTVLGKGKKIRFVPLTKESQKVLRDYRELWMQQYEKEKSQNQVFISQSGKPLSKRMLQKDVQKWLINAGHLGKASPHVLRHSFATHLLDEGADLLAIKEMLGHSSLSTTQKYTQVSIQKMKETIFLKHPRG